MQTHRQIAKRKTTMWQAAAMGILAVSGAAAALPAFSRWLEPPRDTAKEYFPPAPPAPPPVVDQVALDTAANSLKGTSNFVPAPPPPPVDPIAANGAGPVEPPPPPPSDWAYLGSIITPAKRSALVRIGGQQQIYSIGATHGNDKLVTVEPEYIEIETAGAKKKIDLAARTSLAPTDPPKHPVAFRQPPVIPGGGGAGNPAMSLGARMTQPGPTPGALGQPPGTMDQARAAAAAMAAQEAARRAMAPVNPPDMPGVGEKGGPVSEEDRLLANKYLMEPGVGDDERWTAIRRLGIYSGMPVDQAIGRMKEAGIDLNNEAGKANQVLLELNAKGGGPASGGKEGK